MVDTNTQRRHSMDTSQFSPTHLTNNTVTKSRSTTMSLTIEDSTHVSDQLLSPTNNRKKSVSSKERLFSVESLHRLSSAKSIEHLMKVATQSSDTKHNTLEREQKHSINHNEQKSTPLVKQTSLNVTNILRNVNKKNQTCVLFFRKL